MSLYLCNYHNNDLEYYGVPIGKGQHHEPEITCQCCRKNFFTEEEVKNYENKNFCNYIEFSRSSGFPERLRVVIDDVNESLEMPAGFEGSEKKFGNPHVVSDNNTRFIQKNELKNWL